MSWITTRTESTDLCPSQLTERVKAKDVPTIWGRPPVSAGLATWIYGAAVVAAIGAVTLAAVWSL